MPGWVEPIDELLEDGFELRIVVVRVGADDRDGLTIYSAAWR